MILLIITAAFILNLAISLTGVAEAMTTWVTRFGLTAHAAAPGADASSTCCSACSWTCCR